MTISVRPINPAEAIDLSAKKGLVVGITNEHSLAWAATQHFHAAGADLALTYFNNKALAYVEPLAKRVAAPIFMPCDLTQEGSLEAVFATIEKTWGRLDFLLHSIAWAPAEDLHGRLTDSSSAGFAQSMLVSCHSFIRMAKLAEPLMTKGGSLITLSFLGAEKVVDHYNVMGPVKAALESSFFDSNTPSQKSSTQGGAPAANTEKQRDVKKQFAQTDKNFFAQTKGRKHSGSGP